MQSTNMISDEQVQNGVQRSPLDALDKAIGTADTSFSLFQTLGEPEEIREAHVSSPVEMKIPESQGSSAEKAASSTVRPIIPTGPLLVGGLTNIRQDDSSQVPEGQTCLGCKATSTPEWRRGPMGE